MKIKLGANLIHRTFGDLCVGDCFRYPSGSEIYLKIDRSMLGSADYNHVALSSGILYYTYNSKSVIPLPNATVVVE